MSLLGGPWGIALTVAGVALSAFISRQQKAKEAAEQLQSLWNPAATSARPSPEPIRI